LINNAIFCTGDGAAVRAMTVLGFDGQVISLEAVLDQAGYKEKITLPWEYTKSFVIHHIKEGKRLLSIDQE
jgi:hypothetical protein